MITNILVPVDFGDSDEQSVEYAITLSEKFDAKLTLLHATWLPPSGFGGLPGPVAWPLDDMEREAKKALEPLFKRIQARCPNAEVVYALGEPWEQILATAKQRGADLIVMGTHGRRGFQHFLLGSVAERVVRMSPVPVLTVSAAPGRIAKEKALAQSVAASV